MSYRSLSRSFLKEGSNPQFRLSLKDFTNNSNDISLMYGVIYMYIYIYDLFFIFIFLGGEHLKDDHGN